MSSDRTARRVSLQALISEMRPRLVRQRRARAYERRLGPAVIDRIVRAYADGRSVAEISRSLGLGAAACTSLLRRRGVTIRTGPDYIRLAPVRAAVFEAIESEEAAYWLGFISADGSVSGIALEVELQERDRDQLERLAEFLSPGAPIRDHHISGPAGPLVQPRFAVSSRRLIESLARLGVEANKSLTLEPCRDVPDELARHYWRGVVDGDGSIWLQDGTWHVEMVGSPAMAEGFRQFLLGSGVTTTARVLPARTLHAGIDDAGRTLRRPSTHARRFGVGGLALPRQVVRLLYGGAKVFMPRKGVLAEELMSATGRFDAVLAATPERYLELLAQGKNPREIADAMGIGPTTLWKLRKQWGLGK